MFHFESTIVVKFVKLFYELCEFANDVLLLK
jgi:hypothetical protein